MDNCKERIDLGQYWDLKVNIKSQITCPTCTAVKVLTREEGDE